MNIFSRSKGNVNQKLIHEIILILVIKIFFLLLIKHIWFSAPVVLKGDDINIEQHFLGNSSQSVREEISP
jgi:hypothetical protein